jgi:molybdopterin synthase sulfur carrier subunit
MCRTDKEQESKQYDHHMLVEIKLFASCRELIGRDKITLKLKNQATVGDLRKKILELYPILSSQTQFVVVLNCEVVDEITPIGSEDVLAILPPVSGG